MIDSKPWSKHFSEESGPLLERIGVIGLLFSALERSIDDHYLTYAADSGPDYDTISKNFLKFQRRENLEIAYIFERYREPEPVKAAISNLLDCFSWCANCRNNILHSEIYPTTYSPRDVLTIYKRVNRSASLRYMKLTIETLDRIANFTHSCWMQ